MGRDRGGGDGIPRTREVLSPRKMELGKDPSSKLHKSSLATLLLGSIPPKHGAGDTLVPFSIHTAGCLPLRTAWSVPIP